MRHAFCEICGLAGRLKPDRRGRVRWTIHGHHPDYTKPNDTIGLCPKCHRNVHNGTISEPGTGRIYKRRKNRVRVAVSRSELRDVVRRCRLEGLTLNDYLFRLVRLDVAQTPGESSPLPPIGG